MYAGLGLPRRLGWCALALAVCHCSFSATPAGVAPDRDAAVQDSATRDAAAHDGPAGDDATAAATDAASGCPASYTLKFHGHSYRPVLEGAYPSVVASCHADGQYVVAINDSNENTWVLGQLVSSNNFVWIGLHFTAGTWTWDDGTPLGAGFESFVGPPPTSPADPCVDAHQTDGAWASFRCDAPHPTLCECNGP
jgi:hypothetical protein